MKVCWRNRIGFEERIVNLAGRFIQIPIMEEGANSGSESQERKSEGRELHVRMTGKTYLIMIEWIAVGWIL